MNATPVSKPSASVAQPDSGARRRAQALGRWLLGLCRGLLRWFPWTPLGVLVAAGSGWSLWSLAYRQFDVVWLVLAYAVAALSLLSPVCVLLAAAVLARRGLHGQGVEPLSLETGGARATGYHLPALSWLPMVQLRWRWSRPVRVDVTTHVERGRRHESVRFARRGRLPGYVRLLRIEDPFGLSRVTLERPSEQAVDVLPHLGALSRVPSLMSYASGDDLPHPMGVDDGDRVELSRYVPGDPARFIHWRVFARTRQLMVRRPERALSVARRVAAFMVAGPDDDASAAIARLCVSRGMLGGEWRFGTDVRPAGTGRVDEAITWLCESAAHDARGGRGLSAFIEGVRSEGPAAFIVFAPARPGPWLQQVVDCAGSARLRVLIGTDGVSKGRPTPLWRRLFWRRDPVSATTEEQLDTVVQTLASAHCEVSVVDRSAGRVLSEQHRRAMVAYAQKGAA